MKLFLKHIASQQVVDIASLLSHTRDPSPDDCPHEFIRGPNSGAMSTLRRILACSLCSPQTHCATDSYPASSDSVNNKHLVSVKNKISACGPGQFSLSTIVVCCGGSSIISLIFTINEIFFPMDHLGDLHILQMRRGECEVLVQAPGSCLASSA